MNKDELLKLISDVEQEMENQNLRSLNIKAFVEHDDKRYELIEQKTPDGDTYRVSFGEAYYENHQLLLEVLTYKNDSKYPIDLFRVPPHELLERNNENKFYWTEDTPLILKILLEDIFNFLHKMQKDLEEKEKIEKLVELAKEANKEYESKKDLHYTKDEAVNKGLCDINNRPYLFVLACIMDRQIPAERAWVIPHKVCEHFKAKNFNDLANICEKRGDEITAFFVENGLHRYNEIMAQNFMSAVQRIKEEYGGDASKIWSGRPSSAEVVYRFLCFKGVGVKIATMATNILQRDLGVQYSDLSAIDASPDVQVRRVMKRLGFTSNEHDSQQTIYKAKAIYPQYPGVIDYLCWKVGRDYCHPSNPNFKECELKGICEKNCK